MRYRIDNYEISGNTFVLPKQTTIDDIRLIIDETSNIVICSSMQKSNVTVSNNIVTVPTSIATLDSTHHYTIEVDYGDNIEPISEELNNEKSDLIAAFQSKSIPVTFTDSLGLMASKVRNYCLALGTNEMLPNDEFNIDYLIQRLSNNSNIWKKINSTATEIRPSAFKGCTSLDSVILPEALTIGSNAFQGCTSLDSVNLPEALTIGSNAFQGCTSLDSVNLPEALNIDSYAFQGCTGLEYVNCPKAETIGTYAFNRCIEMEEFEFPNAIIVDIGAFSGCTNLKTLKLPNATSLRPDLLSGTTSITRLYIPKVSSTLLTAYFVPTSRNNLITLDVSSIASEIPSFIGNNAGRGLRHFWTGGMGFRSSVRTATGDKLYDYRISAKATTSLNLSYWTPTDAISGNSTSLCDHDIDDRSDEPTGGFANNLAKFVWYFEKFIDECLDNVTSATLTLSTAIRNVISAKYSEQDPTKTLLQLIQDKGWTVA